MNDSTITKANEQQAKAGEMSKFDELMQKIAELPADQQEKIAFFVNGYIAAKQIERGAAAV